MYVASGIEKDDSSDEDYIMKGINEPEEAIAIDEFDVERAPGMRGEAFKSQARKVGSNRRGTPAGIKVALRTKLL
ncbi:hypothetical protein PR003_g4356 [Phytophthora rubi]|uniref:Uncharacterized protein n=1 Tax=Phytophthora rubi TaxID=129364 RepID=A0A6A4FX16_9STRA|nr:hypothetical protein PR002_g6577 [Phytophthora rubi]KAE9042542.1 hypothetical protein PR001_g6148 [Phytophthora rubi]KAE9352484.1 hypothetical protein PR003_g4356 [Phytophthora rubi]